MVDARMQMDDFLHYMSHNRRMSPHTILAYTSDLGAFYSFLENDATDPGSWKPIHIRSWISAMMENGMSSKSVHRKISSLRAFLKYLRKQGVVNHNPMAKVTLPKIPKKIVQDIPAVDLEQLFARFPWNEYEQGQRDRLILLTFYTTGIRLSELIGIKVADIDFDRNNITILGKRNKQRIIPLHPELADSIADYAGNNNNKLLFTTNDGLPLYPMLLYRLVTKYLQLFSTAMKTSPHVLRHSFATHMLNNGANLMAIKDLLGHASLSATQVYTKNSFEKLRAVHKLHPRG